MYGQGKRRVYVVVALMLGAVGTLSLGLFLSRSNQQDAKLWFAIKVHDTNQVKLLLDKGANPNMHDPSEEPSTSPLDFLKHLLRRFGRHSQSQTALLLAVQQTPDEALGDPSSNTYSIIKLLLDHGADVNERGPFGEAPLTIAVQEQQTSLVQLLLKQGANVDVTADGGWTPLMYAYPAEAEVLLQYGANVNKRTLDGTTPLMTAAWFGHDTTVIFLLNHGADLHATNNRHESALTMAIRGGHKGTALLLKTYHLNK